MGQNINKYTGVVLSVGNGTVGKSSLSRILDQQTLGQCSYNETISGIKKTKNLEFDFIPIRMANNGTKYKVLVQLLVPPGQKESEGDRSSRSFEEIIRIYEFYIRKLDVVLFMYKIDDPETYFDIDQWVDKVIRLCSPNTNFLLLGTHIDQVNNRQISPDQVKAGLAHINQKITGLLPNWRGFCHRLEISNLTGENLEELKLYLAHSIIHSQSGLCS